jgi:hypothetical protein
MKKIKILISSAIATPSVQALPRHYAEKVTAVSGE